MSKTFAFALLAFLPLGCREAKLDTDIQNAWDVDNKPDWFGENYKKTFVELPLSGRVPEELHAWSDSYWPNQLGGIAQRWHQPSESEDAFNYILKTEAEIKAMKPDDIARLSPAEKYDILMNRFDFPTVKAERNRNKPSAESWEGLGHGWAAASVLYIEPGPVTVKTERDITIPFGASDVKALLTYYEAVVRQNAGSSFIGTRCDFDMAVDPTNVETAACRDTNAGALHVALANSIGLEGKGFVIDITRDLQIWNKPVLSYETQIIQDGAPSEGAAEGTVREVELKTKLVFATETKPNWFPLVGTEAQLEKEMLLHYRVEIDASGNIIGGEWLQSERPDFAWKPTKGELPPYWKGLNKIYLPAR